jgi:hypothetical protein
LLKKKNDDPYVAKDDTDDAESTMTTPRRVSADVVTKTIDETWPKPAPFALVTVPL